MFGANVTLSTRLTRFALNVIAPFSQLQLLTRETKTHIIHLLVESA